MTVIHGVIGTIGAGKTTWAREMCVRHGFTYIPEFIDMKNCSGLNDAATSLRSFIENKITPYEFQYRILRIINDYLEANPPKGICIIDGPPLFALEIFAKHARNIGRMTNEEFEKLVHMATNLSSKYGLPMTGRCEISHVARNIYPKDVSPQQIVFYVDMSFEDSIAGLRTRGRNGEEGYSMNYLKDIFMMVRSASLIKHYQ
jgi:deoxyadenosine/deoxycytidine kinase